MPSVCFVCLGNICRSPMAEAVFSHLLEEAGIDGWAVDSAGTGHWHVGKGPDPRTLVVCRDQGIPIDCRARQLEAGDLDAFDHILVMDHANLATVQALADTSSVRAQVELLTTWDPQGTPEVDDPYYADDAAFAAIYHQIRRSCEGFLQAQIGR